MVFARQQAYAVYDPMSWYVGLRMNGIHGIAYHAAALRRAQETSDGPVCSDPAIRHLAHHAIYLFEEIVLI